MPNNNGSRRGHVPVVRPSTPALPTVAPYDDTLEAPEGSNHLHWTIQAFGEMGPNGELHDVVVVSVEAPDENGALARAMHIIERPYYRVQTVSETCALDDALRR